MDHHKKYHQKVKEKLAEGYRIVKEKEIVEVGDLFLWDKSSNDLVPWEWITYTKNNFTVGRPRGRRETTVVRKIPQSIKFIKED